LNEFKQSDKINVLQPGSNDVILEKMRPYRENKYPRFLTGEERKRSSKVLMEIALK